MNRAAIQLSPNGLLGFLQLKNGGQFPQTLGSDELQPTIELLDWYAETNSETFQSGPAPAVIGAFSGVVGVPSSEFWYVTDLSVRATAVLGAGVSVEFTPGYTYDILATPKIQTGDQSSGLRTVGQFPTASFGRRFFAPPGASIGFITNVLVAGPPNLVADCRFARLRV